MADPKKCAHQACACQVTNDEFGDYCSPHCQEAGELTELRCECGHPACQA
jgi:hypothetical protein